jgi:hypothetical protein
MNGNSIPTEFSDQTFKIVGKQVAPVGYFDVGALYIER